MKLQYGLDRVSVGQRNGFDLTVTKKFFIEKTERLEGRTNLSGPYFHSPASTTVKVHSYGQSFSPHIFIKHLHFFPGTLGTKNTMNF